MVYWEYLAGGLIFPRKHGHLKALGCVKTNQGTLTIFHGIDLKVKTLYN